MDYQSPAADALQARLAAHLPQLDIAALLGRGGMGAVYLARQVRLDRLVALKVLPPEVNCPSFAARFAREARTLARLSHPHVVGIYDFGEAEGVYYLLMEYVEGGSLRERLRSGPLPPRDALELARQVCDALEYAHGEGVAHRDIKPDNLLLDRRGRVKVADFGLAKLLQPKPAEPHLTASQQVMGTLKYMAPEQLERPQEVDHRADIYALGVVLYEMLTGEIPVGRFEPPSAKGVADRRIDGVVLKALEREPGRRYQGARELRAALDSLLSQPESPSETTQPMATPRTGGSGLLWNHLREPFLLRVERDGLAVFGRLLRNPLGWAFLLSLGGAVVCLEPFWPWAELLAWDGRRRWPIPVGSVYGYNSQAGLIPAAALLLLWCALLPGRRWQTTAATLIAAGFVVGFFTLLMFFSTGSEIHMSDPTVTKRSKAEGDEVATVTNAKGDATVTVLGTSFPVGVEVTSVQGGYCTASYRIGGREVVVARGEEGSETNDLSVVNPLGPLRTKVHAWPYILGVVGLTLITLGCLLILRAAWPRNPGKAA